MSVIASKKLSSLFIPGPDYTTTSFNFIFCLSIFWSSFCVSNVFIYCFGKYLLVLQQVPAWLGTISVRRVHMQWGVEGGH